jgi:N-acetylglucosaminyldiphosphoundecaprenol N-acetyl-beta-D-mannosaminyltransferase
MRERGLEWLYRLWREPRRLWRRYLVTNTAFVLGAAAQLVRPRR